MAALMRAVPREGTLSVIQLQAHGYAKKNYSPAPPLPPLHARTAHQHGSTALHTPTTNGLVIINDNNAKWLSNPGCFDFKMAYATAQEVVLHM